MRSLIPFSRTLAWRQILPALCGFLFASGLAAQAAGPRLEPNYSASIGGVTLGDEQFYRLCFRPDIPLGNWGVALDLELFIDNQGQFSDRGWAFGTSTEALDSILRKIYYVRYGKSGDDTFFKIGALDRVTLGYGLIMDRYRNTLYYPGIKKTGVQFELRKKLPLGVGIEGIISNLQDFQQGGGLIGLRAFSQPLGRLEMGATYVIDLDQYAGLVDSDGDGYPDEVDAFPSDKKRALDNDGDGIPDGLDLDDNNDGAIDVDPNSGLPADVIAQLEKWSLNPGSAIRVTSQLERKQPFNKDRVKKDRFSVFGVDAAYPLLRNRALELKLYGQAAWFLDDKDKLSQAQADSQGVAFGNRQAKGFGLGAPGLWLQLGPADGQLEFRYFKDDFDAGYFDNLYDLDRARLDVATGRATPKDAQLIRGETLTGFFGHAGTDIAGLVYAYADYQYLTGADDPKQQLHASAHLAEQLLQRLPRLTQAQVYYQKNNIGAGLSKKGNEEDDFFESTEDTFYGYILGLEMTGGVALMWDTRFYFERDADTELQRKKAMFIETVFSF